MSWKRCVAIGLLLLVTGCVDEGSRPVSQEEFGYWWPLTVPRGKLACFRSESLEVIYFAAPDGKEYTAGTAVSHAYSLATSYKTVFSTFLNPLDRDLIAVSLKISSKRPIWGVTTRPKPRVRGT